MDVASASAVVVALVVAPNTGIKVEVDVSEVVCTVVEPDDWESATAFVDEAVTAVEASEATVVAAATLVEVGAVIDESVGEATALVDEAVTTFVGSATLEVAPADDVEAAVT